MLELEENYNQTIFEIKEATGEGNYNDPELWSFSKINDYLHRKQKQVEKLKRLYKNAK